MDCTTGNVCNSNVAIHLHSKYLLNYRTIIMKIGKFIIYKNTVLQIRPAQEEPGKKCLGCFFDGRCRDSEFITQYYGHQCSVDNSIYVKVGKLLKQKK